MRVRYLDPVPVYKTANMKDFEFDCDPEDGLKFQTFATLGPDNDGDGIPGMSLSQEICTGNYDIQIQDQVGFDRQGGAIDWLSMQVRLYAHSLLAPGSTSSGMKILISRSYSYWLAQWNKIRGGGQWAYATGYGYDYPGLVDCDDDDAAVPYLGVFKDTDKDGYPDDLSYLSCYDSSLEGKNWITYAVSEIDSSGNLSLPAERSPQPSIVDCEPRDPEIFEECCADLQTAEGRMTVFKSGFDPSKYSEDGNGGMVLKFSPVCSDGKPVPLKHLAKSMGFDHFNWWQSMNDSNAVTYSVSSQTLAKFKSGVTSFYSSEFMPEPEWIIDPILDHKGYYIIAAVHPMTGERVGMYINKDGADNHPYFWNEGNEVQSKTSKYSLLFSDYPYGPVGWYAPFGPLQQPPTRFMTRVAGIRADGTFVLWSTAHVWTTNIGHCGDLSCPLFQNFTITAKNPVPPAGWENRTGEVTYEGAVGLDIIVTPDVVGKSSESSTIDKFLEGSGFSISIAGYQASQTIPEGTIISQIPAGLTEVSSREKIQVIVSSGSSQNCGDLTNGQTATRIRYHSSEMPFGQSCDGVEEVQTGTCMNGTITYSGTAQFEMCTVQAAVSCGEIPHGDTATRVRYWSQAVPFGSTCDSVKEIQTATCNNDNLTYSGSASFDTCTVQNPKSCDNISHGDTTTRVRYLSQEVPFGSTCDGAKEIQTATCNNGSLIFSGTASFETCTVQTPKSCGEIPHGRTIKRYRYQSSEVPNGTSCEDIKEEQTGSCNDGVINFTGTFEFDSCVVLPPATTGCEKTKTTVCKAHWWGTKTCHIPGTIISVSIDKKYKGSRCRKYEPEWDAKKGNSLLYILKSLDDRLNSYTYDDDSIKVYYGCDAKFEVKYTGKCKRKD